jgi:hypothetical protein
VWGDSVGAGIVAHLSEMSLSDLKYHLLFCLKKKDNKNSVSNLQTDEKSLSNNPAFYCESVKEMQNETIV